MMRIFLAPRFIRQYRRLSKADQEACDAVVEKLPEAFGNAHRHSGLGVRALRRGVYECRVGLALRIGFTQHRDVLLLQTIGNHDTLRAWLRSGL
jgi:mRNA-degrading endonuclease RelE of RelBE toxin-antitoxin system